MCEETRRRGSETRGGLVEAAAMRGWRSDDKSAAMMAGGKAAWSGSFVTLVVPLEIGPWKKAPVPSSWKGSHREEDNPEKKKPKNIKKEIK